jgi:hypothetical protein
MPARLLFVAFLFAAALPARAGDAPAGVPLPPITPVDGYFVMTQDDATTSSKCIGDPVTPLCAVETVMACEIRGNDDLCRIGMGLKKNPGLSAGPVSPRIYWVMHRAILTDETIPWDDHELKWRPGEAGVQAGDVRIDIADKICEKGEISHTACKTEDDLPAIAAYIVRQQGDRWAVINWRPPYVPPY